MVYYLFSCVCPSLFLRIYRKLWMKNKIRIEKVYIKIEDQNGGEVGEERGLMTNRIPGSAQSLFSCANQVLSFLMATVKRHMVSYIKEKIKVFF